MKTKVIPCLIVKLTFEGDEVGLDEGDVVGLGVAGAVG